MPKKPTKKSSVKPKKRRLTAEGWKKQVEKKKDKKVTIRNVIRKKES